MLRLFFDILDLKELQVTKSDRDGWPGPVELHPIPPPDAKPSVDQLMKLKEHTNAAIGQFEDRREQFATAKVLDIFITHNLYSLVTSVTWPFRLTCRIFQPPVLDPYLTPYPTSY